MSFFRSVSIFSLIFVAIFAVTIALLLGSSLWSFGVSSTMMSNMHDNTLNSLLKEEEKIMHQSMNTAQFILTVMNSMQYTQNKEHTIRNITRSLQQPFIKKIAFIENHKIHSIYQKKESQRDTTLITLRQKTSWGATAIVVISLKNILQKIPDYNNGDTLFFIQNPYHDITGYHTKFKRFFRIPPEHPAQKNIVTQKNNLKFETTNFRLQHKTIILNQKPYILTAGLACSDIDNILYTHIFKFFSFFLIALAPSLWIAYYAAKKITQPLVTIQKYLEQLANNAPPTPLPAFKHWNTELKGVVRIVIQYTELQKKNKKLLQINRRYSQRLDREHKKILAIIEHTNQGILLLDHKLQIILANPEAQKMFSCQNMKHKTPMHYVNEEERLPLMNAIQQANPQEHHLLHIFTGDNQHKIFEYICTTIQVQQSHYYSITFSDVTKKIGILKELSEYKKAITLSEQHSKMGYFTLENNLSDITLSPQCLKNLQRNITTAKEFVSLLPQKAQKQWEQMLQKKLTSFSTELSTFLGRHLIIHVYLSKEENNNEIFGTIQDITTFKEYEHKLREECKNTEQQTKDKLLFLSKISHEVRSPITAIHGLTQIIPHTYEECQTLLKNIDESAQYLMGLINDLLDFSKIQHNKLSITEEPFNLHKTLKNTIHFTISLLKKQKNNVMFYLLTDPTIPDQLLGDEQRIKQILFNILSNAVKFTHEGTIILSVSYVKSNIIFKVTDTGEGMNREQLKTAGTLFFHNKSHNGGAGIGLLLCRELLDKMGGTMDLQSEHHQGTEVTISIPLSFKKTIATEPVASSYPPLTININNHLLRAQVENAVEHYHLPITTESTGLQVTDALCPKHNHCIQLKPYTQLTQHNTQHILYYPFILEDFLNSVRLHALNIEQIPRILVAEDDPNHIKILEYLLQNFNVPYTLTHNGQEALHLLKTDPVPYDMILTDAYMPIINGLQLLQHIQKETHLETIPIIILTASGPYQSREIEQYIEAGASDILHKPLNPQKLIYLLHKYNKASTRPHLEDLSPVRSEPIEQPTIELPYNKKIKKFPLHTPNLARDLKKMGCTQATEQEVLQHTEEKFKKAQRRLLYGKTEKTIKKAIHDLQNIFALFPTQESYILCTKIQENSDSSVEKEKMNNHILHILNTIRLYKKQDRRTKNNKKSKVQ